MQYLRWALTNGNAVLTLSILIPIHHHWPNSILERLRNKRLDWHTETLTWSQWLEHVERMSSLLLTTVSKNNHQCYHTVPGWLFDGLVLRTNRVGGYK